MSVVATDGKSMAGDGIRVSGWTIIELDVVKVFRLGKDIYGVVGNASDKVKFRRYLEKGGYVPTLSDDFTGLVLKADGTILRYDSDCVGFECTAPHAIGAGYELALAAMDAGKTPTEAVEIACHRNTHCGGKITELTLLSN